MNRKDQKGPDKLTIATVTSVLGVTVVGVILIAISGTHGWWLVLYGAVALLPFIVRLNNEYKEKGRK